jgi:hypothetical protein
MVVFCAVVILAIFFCKFEIISQLKKFLILEIEYFKE